MYEFSGEIQKWNRSFQFSNRLSLKYQSDDATFKTVKPSMRCGSRIKLQEQVGLMVLATRVADPPPPLLERPFVFECVRCRLLRSPLCMPNLTLQPIAADRVIHRNKPSNYR